MVSVILPNYNHAPYLKQRIDSILNQTYQDIELIILDDCSLDNSREIIFSYKDNSKVSSILFNEKNSGSTFLQWKRGFEKARGEYIWIAESDDYADEIFLDTLIAKMSEDQEIVIGFTGLYFVDENGHKLGFDLKNEKKNFVKCYKGIDFIKNRMLLGNSIYNASSVVFRKEILSHVDMDFVNYQADGDWLFWIEIAKFGKVLELSRKMDYFRQHSCKVSPKAASSGLNMIEAHRIYRKLLSQGFISKIKKEEIVGFRLYQILLYNRFDTPDTFRQVFKIWSKESFFSYLSIVVYFLCRILHVNSK